MRDLVLGPALLWLAIQGIRHPWIGIMGWTWVSIMNPHALSWRLNSMPVAAAMAASVFLGMLVTKDRRNFYITRESGVLMVFMLWMCITQIFSYFPADSLRLWDRVMKIDLMILVALVVLYSKKHITTLVWVVVGSLAFYGVKGGLFTIATGGSYRVWGPTGSYIEGNNEVALALVMVIPLMRFLHLTAENKWIKRGLLVSMGLCAAAALGSQSRGALLAIAAMMTVLWWRSDKKVVGMVVLLVLAGALLSMMPQTWWDRMGTIETYDEDASAMGRINSWWMAWNLAKDNFFGGGFQIYKPSIFALYAPDPNIVLAAHSIYFMVLGEQGFVGLFLFLLLWAFTWFSASHLRKEGRKQPQTMWLTHLGSMCQVSLVGYAVGGSFLSLSYYDLPYNVMIMVVLGKRWLANKEWVVEEKQAQEEAARAALEESKPGKRRWIG